MKLQKFAGSLVLAMLLALSGAASATTLGIGSTPAGAIWSRGDSNTAFGVFDTFPGTSYAGDTADSSSGITGLTLDQPTTFTNFGQGAGTYSNISTFAAGNDILFAGGNALNFTLAGSTSFTIGTVYLTVKRPNNLTGVIADFTPQLSLDSGITWLAASGNTLATATGDTNSTSGNSSLSTWYWIGSAVDAANSSSMLIKLDSNGASQRPVDGIAVDVAAVPEPSTYAMLGLGLVVVFAALRRRTPVKA